jgi:GntR family transcriptional regulator, transcriptional repressor for pyruvate dehydrogenase complex
MPAPLHEPDRTQVSERVRRAIADMIAGGDLAPGERLPGERQLAERMGVSRVSVRAALQQLKTQGFLVAIQGGGTRVVSSVGGMDQPLAALVRLQSEGLSDLAEIRLMLESWAANRAARFASDAQIAEIDAAARRMEDPRRADHRADDDVAFHLAVGRAAASPIYMHFLSVVQDALGDLLAFHHGTLFAAGSATTIVAQHATIRDAIASRDPGLAERAMREHLEWVLAHYPDAVPDGD